MSVLPPGFQKLDSVSLPAANLARLKAIAKAQGGNKALVQGNLGGEVALTLIGLLVLVGACYGTFSGKGKPLPLLVGFAIALLLVGLGGEKLLKRARQPFFTCDLVTDAYAIRSDGGSLEVLSMAHCVRHEFTKHLRNGLYSATALTLHAEGGGSLTFSERLKSEDRDRPGSAKEFAALLSALQRAKAARTAGTWSTLAGADLFPIPPRA